MSQSQSSSKIKRLPFDCDSIDEILGGGIEYGVVSNIFGESGSGKSNIALLMAVKALKRHKDKNVLFVDTEGSFSTERLSQLYSDFSQESERIILAEPHDFEQQHEDIASIKERDEDLSLIVVDSLVALYRLSRDEDNSDSVNKKLAKQLSELSNIAREENIPVLVTTQVYSTFDGTDVQLVSRDVAKYWSKCLIKLEKLGKGKRKATLVKHRSRPEGESTEFYITQEGLTEEPEESSIF